jgi:hypothetical protein
MTDDNINLKFGSLESPMKLRCIILFLVCCMLTLTGCDGRSDGASASNSDSATAQAWKDYNARVKQQDEAYAQQAKSANEQLRAQADMQKRAEARFQAQEDLQKRADALMTTQEQMIKRQQDDFARFEKILDTWESQQKLYQKYLDSLSK